MTATVFHVLTETDSFSDLHGAALQRWVANVLRLECDEAVVACARADTSWGLNHVRTLLLPGLLAYSALKGRYHLPWRIRRPLLRRIFRPLIQALRPGSIVWIHNRPDYAAAIESDIRQAGGKIAVHLHNSLLISFPSVITRSFQADRLVFCSRYLELEALAAFPAIRNSAVIHNGADALRFFPASPCLGTTATRRSPIALFAGRLVPEKGAHIFVEAMWLLKARGVRVVGRLVGATGFGSRNSATRYSRALMRDPPANIEFGGYRAAADLGREFRNADLFCSPSVWEEPFGLVNVEAMASRLPTISTRGGGVPEIFSEGGAILVSRGSAVELANAVEALLRDETLRRKLADDGYLSFQKNFTWQAVHRRYRQVLTSLA